jgi:integrase
MRQHRGVTESTLRRYDCVLARLLEVLGDEPRRYSARGLREFVLGRAKRPAHSARAVATPVRVFVRYLIAQGQCPAALEAAVPTVAHWRLSALPRYLPDSDVDRIIATCDPTTPVGARDRAILLLLARLGLRAGDVVALRLDELDWQDGSFRVTGKGRRESRLPLPQQVGDALLVYLKRGRPLVAADQVFIRAHAPLGPLGCSGAVSRIVARAMLRAGVVTPWRGAHVLRHSAATAMLRQGVCLDAISTVLRHRSIETTAHYAKVDTALLRQVAQPWPEETPC